MNIKTHFDLLIDTYNLHHLYKKYIFISILFTVVRESFQWCLLGFSLIVKKHSHLIYKFIYILLFIYLLLIPLEKYFNNIKFSLIKELKIANYKYFKDKLFTLDKDKLLILDLVEFFNTIEHFNECIEFYILNIKIKYDIPFRFISLIIIAINKKIDLLIILFIIFIIIVNYLNNEKIIKEKILMNDYFEYDTIIRKYLINSKHFLINNDFNNEYLLNNINKFVNINNDIEEVNNKLDFNINIWMFIYIIIIIKSKLNMINEYDFYFYFIIIFDIEYISDKFLLYYKNKYIMNKMEKRLLYLYNIISNNNNIEKDISIIDIDKIIINKFNNCEPKLINNNKIIINKNDHILVTGKSGSGKTSLLYLLKGILKIPELNIEPNIDYINNQSYLTLSNNKSIYSGLLYDIISNYSLTFDIDLINYALKFSKLNNKLNENIYIDIDKLSSGERIRLLIARIIYTVKYNNKYSILLFDEIDENLNDDLAIEIYKSIHNIFNDKIILYITHNEKVKKLFNKIILVNNGNISYINKN
jgi:ABC-type lipoprotein export system ATPase subunit